MIILEAKTKAGVWVKIEFEDKGDLVPGYDLNGNRFEAFTDWFRVRNGSAIPGLVSFNQKPDKPCDLENYVQVSRKDLECSPDARWFRQRERLRSLDAAGIDISTVRMPATMNGVNRFEQMYLGWFEADAELIKEARGTPS